MDSDRNVGGNGTAGDQRPESGIPPELLIPEARLEDISDRLLLAFAPLHKRAMGTAIGLALGIVVFGLTAFHILILPDDPIGIGLAREYFYGYEVSWKGAFLGFFWGFVAGFAAGWFGAFLRNLVVATSVWVTRTRAELAATRDFLDHI